MARKSITPRPESQKNDLMLQAATNKEENNSKQTNNCTIFWKWRLEFKTL